MAKYLQFRFRYSPKCGHKLPSSPPASCLPPAFNTRCYQLASHPANPWSYQSPQFSSCSCPPPWPSLLSIRYPLFFLLAFLISLVAIEGADPKKATKGFKSSGTKWKRGESRLGSSFNRTGLGYDLSRESTPPGERILNIIYKDGHRGIR